MTPSEMAMLARLTPEQIVAATLWGEARGASAGLRAAIAGVIQNRVNAQRTAWGLTPQDVCLAPGQFSCWSIAGGAANYSSLMDAVVHIAENRQPQGPVLRECLALAWHVTGGQLDDTTKGADSYWSPAAMVPPGRVPKAAIGKPITAIIDGTHFYIAEAA